MYTSHMYTYVGMYLLICEGASVNVMFPLTRVYIHAIKSKPYLNMDETKKLPSLTAST
jgi:hypothetical protein